jgi:RHS repeat-associated protein
LSNQAFSYDANDRLESDTYDANGNTRVGKVALNAQGAEALAQTVNDSYDSENRLTSRTAPSGNVQVVYDGDGNKVRETANGQTISYSVDTQNPTGYAQVVEELQNGTVIRTYTYGHDLLVQDQRDGSGNWAATWFGYDGHGSVRLLTNALGHITDRYDYDAFGVLLVSSGTTLNRYRYCGEQFSPPLGLYHLRARFINAASGRFWSMDAYLGRCSDPLSLHKYLYANADPVGGIDPTGSTSIAETTAAEAESATFVKVSAVRVAFETGGARAGGAALQEVGAVVEGSVAQITRSVGAKIVDTSVKTVVSRLGGQRAIDLLVKIADRLVFIESKYQLPFKAGPQLVRLIGQIESAVATGGREIIVATAKDASPAALEMILSQLSAQAASRVTFVLGYANLARYLSGLMLD